jgi:hypothetical protein
VQECAKTIAAQLFVLFKGTNGMGCPENIKDESTRCKVESENLPCRIEHLKVVERQFQEKF